MSWGNEYQAASESGATPGRSVLRGAIVCTDCPLPRPNRISTARPTPNRGSNRSAAGPRPAAAASDSLMSSVSATAARHPIRPPSNPAAAQAAIAPIRVRPCSILFCH